ncbi:MAG: N-acyl amino acid synthase FeeM domain-containing protein [Thermodesulfobacteriota bacterium]
MALNEQAENFFWQTNNAPFYERRRTLRIKRSGLQKRKLIDIDRPAIKFAETREELIKSFSLVYDVYLEKKFIQTPRPHGLLYSCYSLLPDTTHIIAESYLDVLSSLTEVFDSPQFGLPMDVLYAEELNVLRAQGRSIVELSSLATPKEQRWKSFFLYLIQVMYWYSVYRGVDDVCIMVNPRHVRFYKKLYPFEQLGPERYYDRVNADAVALRGRMRESQDRMLEVGRNLEFDTPLFSYFYEMTGEPPDPRAPSANINNGLRIVVKKNQLNTEVVQYFVNTEPSILDDLTVEQAKAFRDHYPDLVWPAR